jgi:serine/threonine protein kinase
LSDHNLADNFFESLVGSKLSDRYHLLSILGAGAFGVVYKAHDSRIDRTVAIKMLRSDPQLEEEYVIRFEREAIAASKLKHPHIITIFDLVWEKNPYLIMDFIEGVSLQDLLQNKRRLNEERAVKLFLQACDAFMHAHRKGVIHRDIKPSNMMLTKDDDGHDFLKIVDFGIARLIEANAAAVKLTATGMAFGTPTYMSPEQCMGQKLDRRTDIYSLGCVMYETLTGKLPIVGDSFLALIHAHINQIPLSFKEACPSLTFTEKIEQIVLKSLAKDVNSRHQSMQELKEELLNLTDGRRSYAKQHHPSEMDNRSHFEPKDRHSAERAAVLDEIEEEENMLLTSIRKEEEQKGEVSPGLVPLLEQLAKLYVEFEEYDKAEREYTRAIKIFRQHYGNSLGTAELMQSLAKLYYDQKRFDEAEHGYRAVLHTIESSLGPEDPEMIYCYEDLSMALNRKKKFAESEQCLRQANTIVNKVFGIRHIEFARLLSYFAYFYSWKDDNDKYEQYLKRALTVAEEILEHNDLALVPFLKELAELKIDQEKIEEAKQLLKRAFGVVNDPANVGCEELISICLWLGEIYLDENEIDKAARFFSAALDSIQSIYGSDSIECYHSLIYLGDCAKKKERFEAAAKLYTQAFDIGRNRLKADDPLILLSITRLGRCFEKQGFQTKAETMFKDALKMAERVFEPGSLEMAEHLLELGVHYGETRRYIEAEPLLRRALSVYEQEYERNDEELLPLLETMLDVCRHLGKTKEAKRFEDWLKEFDT